MKNLIIVSGHLGSTYRAGQYLADKLGGADMFDTAAAPDFPLSGYDTYIFGANIRMFRLNKRFRRWARKLRKELAGKRAYVYLVGVDLENAEKYAEKAKKILPQTEPVFIWGELNSDRAAGFAKSVLESVRAGIEKEGKPMPHIQTDALDRLAEEILRV